MAGGDRPCEARQRASACWYGPVRSGPQRGTQLAPAKAVAGWPEERRSQRGMNRPFWPGAAARLGTLRLFGGHEAWPPVAGTAHPIAGCREGNGHPGQRAEAAALLAADRRLHCWSTNGSRRASATPQLGLEWPRRGAQSRGPATLGSPGRRQMGRPPGGTSTSIGKWAQAASMLLIRRPARPWPSARSWVGLRALSRPA